MYLPTQGLFQVPSFFLLVEVGERLLHQKPVHQKELFLIYPNKAGTPDDRKELDLKKVTVLDSNLLEEGGGPHAVDQSAHTLFSQATCGTGKWSPERNDKLLNLKRGDVTKSVNSKGAAPELELLPDHLRQLLQRIDETQVTEKGEQLILPHLSRLTKDHERHINQLLPLQKETITQWLDITGNSFDILKKRAHGSHYTTHRFCCSGAQHCFLWIKRRWLLGEVKTWGGRWQDKTQTNILCYILNLLNEHENDHSSKLNPLLDQRDWGFLMGGTLGDLSGDGEAGADAVEVSAALHSLAKEVASLRAQVVNLSRLLQYMLRPLPARAEEDEGDLEVVLTRPLKDWTVKERMGKQCVLLDQHKAVVVYLEMKVAQEGAGKKLQGQPPNQAAHDPATAGLE
ncbi:hypothetical protein BDK51DRAFT_26797 [Blyttiomyces helicus]|uniref:Uncharacterized protein n=1 Tax=Blyttiomyces helicus TaxID=388810 RepID=A0A4P9WP96_9FUNG|nr:hypothetical protein BDK51DRAFT_26797 [Blyttiomyces helicus]|eukprot:RKO94135.1 hypothetical protein BDK51DRAFT_26797 [Blyttiomyces helicus]